MRLFRVFKAFTLVFVVSSPKTGQFRGTWGIVAHLRRRLRERYTSPCRLRRCAPHGKLVPYANSRNRSKSA